MDSCEKISSPVEMMAIVASVPDQGVGWVSKTDASTISGNASVSSLTLKKIMVAKHRPHEMTTRKKRTREPRV